MRVVAGRYAIVDELGRGGMGVVWRAQDQVIGRPVALKELPTPSGLSTEERGVYLERVLREARTAGRLSDAAIVTVFDVVSENGVTFIVMELVEAPTLADIIAGQGALPAERVANLGVQVLGALRVAHAAGIVHRDVKPSNIMVLPGDRVKLADFGIARAMDDPSLTMTGGIMGSPGYMAPELFAGSAPSPASDLWALGATLFHAVEGKAPFNRETTAATMHAIMYDDPSLTRCDGPVAGVIMGLLAQPADRRLTAAQAEERLTDATKSDMTQVVEPPTVQVRPVQRTTLPREPWQDPYFSNEQPPLAAPAPVAWGTQDDWTPRNKKSKGRQIALMAGGAVVLIGALVAVFLITPSSQNGKASAQQNDSTTVVAVNAIPSTAPSSAPISASAPPPSSAPSASGSTPPPTVTVVKSGAQPTTGGGQQPPPPGNPPTKTTPAPPPRTLVVLTRYNHPTGWHISTIPSIPVPSGFSKEFALGSLVAASEANTRQIYECKITTNDDHFTSGDAKCEGQTLVGTLGYVFTAAPAGVTTKPMYRCTYNGGHFDSNSANCEGNHQEGLIGYLVG